MANNYCTLEFAAIFSNTCDGCTVSTRFLLHTQKFMLITDNLKKVRQLLCRTFIVVPLKVWTTIRTSKKCPS